jgi:RNA polymerase sigma-70 factor (ECF subfamily)
MPLVSGRHHSMVQTPPSLLERLREPTDQVAWNRFVELYTPLLYKWLRRAGLNDDQAADLMQEVFVLLIRKLPEFRYTPDRSFRAWLKTVTLNKWREGLRRGQPMLKRLSGSSYPEEGSADIARVFEETEYHQQLVRRAIRLIQTDFQPVTGRAFWEYVVMGRPAAEVAAELGVAAHSVYLAKSRVLRRLREELDGLLG